MSTQRVTLLLALVGLLATVGVAVIGLGIDLGNSFLVVTGVVLVLVAFSILSYQFVVMSSRRAQRSANKALREIELLVHDSVVIHNIADRPPDMRKLGPLSVSDDVDSRAEVVEAQLSINEFVAIATTTSKSLRDHPEAISYRSAKYSQLIAMRQIALEGDGSEMPLVVSGIAVVVDSTTGHVVLQRRSPDSTTYPDRLGVIGGLFRSGDGSERVDDYRTDPDLYVTVERETLEEVGAGAKRPVGPWLIVEDKNPGFLQVGPTVLAWEKVSAPRGDVAEGRIEVLRPNELSAALLDPTSWTPGTLIRVLYWLACGAPEGDGEYRKLRREFDRYAEAIRNSGLATKAYELG